MNYMNFAYDCQPNDGKFDNYSYTQTQGKYLMGNDNSNFLRTPVNHPNMITTNSHQIVNDVNSIGTNSSVSHNYNNDPNVNNYNFYHSKASNNADQTNSANSSIWHDSMQIPRTTAGDRNNNHMNLISGIHDNPHLMNSTTNSTATKNYNNNNNTSAYSNIFDSYSKTNTTTDSTMSNQSRDDEDIKAQLRLKDAQIELLENEIQNLKNLFNNGLQHRKDLQKKIAGANNNDGTVQIPASLETIFKKFSNSLQEKEIELSDTKKNLECILTAVAADPSNSSTRFGRYDVEAISHKMIIRLETLTRENQEMSKMLAYGRSKELQIELQLTKKENNELKEQLRLQSQPTKKAKRQT